MATSVETAAEHERILREIESTDTNCIGPTLRSKGMPASQQVRLGRKRPLPSCPNPLFLQWLTELRDDAKEKGLKLQYVYQKKNAAGDQGKNKGGGGGRKKREYIPQRRSGGYAVLLTLYRVSQIPGSKGYMFKMELQAEAQQLCDKSFTVCQTVKEVFARQLMQVSGLSGDKAAAILELYSTPLSLLTAYQRCAGEADKEKLLSSIRYGKLKRNLGPALSRTVYQLYCTQGALT